MTRLSLVGFLFTLVLLVQTSLGGSRTAWDFREAYQYTRIGSVTTQGDTKMRSDLARSTYSIDGTGIKIGVISDSFNTLGGEANDILTGNLPGVDSPTSYTTPVTVVGTDDSGTDEGRAMLQIVHDVAPGAELYFHSAFNNTWGPAPSQTIADAIDGLVAAGVDIIIDDVGILTQARFQDGPSSIAYNNAKAAGIACFSSAGNSSDDATRVQYDSTTSDTVNWGTDDLFEVTVPSGGARLVVQWQDSYSSIAGEGNTATFKVELFSTKGKNKLLLTEHSEPIGEDPYVFMVIGNTGSEADRLIRVTCTEGVFDGLMQLSSYGLTLTDIDDTNSPTVAGHSAADGVIATAAQYWNNTTEVEWFSSLGPTLILFDSDGNPITETRDTPIITAPDGVVTTVPGFDAFYGTSAASPHAGAVAALMLQRADELGIDLSVDELYQILMDTATDIPLSDADLSGYGAIDAYAAVSEVPEPATITLLGCGAMFLLKRRKRAA
jgi:hypothetical protein